MNTLINCDGNSVTPAHFVEDVTAFQQVLDDPCCTVGEKGRACSAIIEEANHISPRAEGYEECGARLKQAICAWLMSGSPHEPPTPAIHT